MDENIKPQFFQTIWLNRHEAPHRIALAKKNSDPFDASVLAAQVKALQKISTKIPTWYRSGLWYPSGLSVEQASSELTANFKAQLFSGENFADLTAGLGVDAYFFSRYFKQLYLVERNPETAAATRHNFEQLGVSHATVLQDEAEAFLSATPLHFDLIFLDPARRDAVGGRVYHLADCSPNILKIKPLVFQKTKKILLKAAPMLDLHQAMEQLGEVNKIWVIGTPDECREVLILLSKNEMIPPEQVPISAVNLYPDAPAERFDFTFQDEKNCSATFAMPQHFLIEPPPVIMKSGAFKLFGQHNGWAKLHPNTHLFTSENKPLQILGGRCFRIEHNCQYDRKTIQNLLPDGRAHLASRNFPDSPEQMRKKLGLRDGGAFYLFGITDMAGAKRVLICRKIEEKTVGSS